MPRIARRLVVALIALVVCLGVGPRGTQAHISDCQTDPLVTLANLTQVTLNEQIADVSTDVTGIDYVRHVPKGVKVQTVIYYGAVPATLQTLTTGASSATVV